MEYKLTEKDILAIEKALKGKGCPKAEVKIENGKIIVLRVTRQTVKFEK